MIFIRHKCITKRVFGIVVAVAFQIIFYVKMHANDVFLFLKNHFWHQQIKTIQNVQIILNFSKKKIKFFWDANMFKEGGESALRVIDLIKPNI